MEYLNKNLFKLISGGILSLSLLLFPSMGYSYSSVDKSVGGATENSPATVIACA